MPEILHRSPTHVLLCRHLSAAGEAVDIHKTNQLETRLNSLESFSNLDDSMKQRIQKLLDDNSSHININKMNDSELNKYISNLLERRNAQIDAAKDVLFPGGKNANLSDKVQTKLETGIDAINETGLLDNMDEARANMIRNQIMEDYFSNHIDLNNISKGELERSIQRYGEMYDKLKAAKNSFTDLINRGYIKEEDLDDIIENHILFKSDEEIDAMWKALGGDDGLPVNAFYYDGNVYLRESNNITTITHEINHALGKFYFYDKYTGILFNHRGLNEALTEKIAIDLTNGPNASGYYFNVNMMNSLMELIKKSGYDDVDLDAYFGNANSSYKMKEIVDSIAGQEGTFDKIAELMDITDGCDSRYTFQDVRTAKIELISIMKELYEKVGG